jgi:hypothetical protein
MAIERTLSIIKPDGVEKGVIGQIISRFGKAGLKPVAMRMAHLSKRSMIAPISPRSTASGLMMDRVRSMAMVCVLPLVDSCGRRCTRDGEGSQATVRRRGQVSLPVGGLARRRPVR